MTGERYGYASEEEYYREEFGGADCPACGATLDESGRRHADGSTCDDIETKMRLLAENTVEMMCPPHDRAEVERGVKLARESFLATLRRSRSSEGATKVMVLVPQGGTGHATLAAWEGEVFAGEVEQIGSSLAQDYGLDDVEERGSGLWVWEGVLRVSAYRCNRPDDPEEWDVSLDWDRGEWRRPLVAEAVALAQGHEPWPAQAPAPATVEREDADDDDYDPR